MSPEVYAISVLPNGVVDIFAGTAHMIGGVLIIEGKGMPRLMRGPSPLCQR